jgi:hypothetical protein
VSENADEPSVTAVIAHALLAAVLSQDGGLMPRRLVQRFDFEEAAVFNPGVPPQIYGPADRAAGAEAPGANALGYPPFGDVSTASGIGRLGAGFAVRFELDGASMVRFLDVNLDDVAAESDLLLRAWTRTDGLHHAAVRVSACYLGADERVIAGITSSEPIRAETGWRMLEIHPPPRPRDAKKLQVWLEVAQPAQLAGVDRDRYDVARRDVRGRAFFDDIELWQMPSVRFEADAHGIIAPSARAALRLRCDDPMVAQCTAHVRVRDAGGAIVAEEHVSLHSGGELRREMPVLPTGWYEAEAVFRGGDSEIARRFARFAVLPDDPFEPDQPPRFGASLGSMAMPLEPAIDLARSAFVVLPVWSESTEIRESTAEIESLRPVVSHLLDRRVEPMFRLGAVPARLAGAMRIEPGDALGLFALEESRWRPALEPWLLAFGQRVDQWFIGATPVDADRPDLAQRVEDIAAAMGSAIAGPSITLPWSPQETVPPTLARAVERGRHTLELVADPAWRESGGEIYADATGAAVTGARGMVRIVPLPADLVDGRERAIDLALRAIDAWRAGFDSVAIEVEADSRPPVPGPALEFAAWRQLSTRLCGRRFEAEIPIAEGVRALLAHGARGTALVLWNESGTEEAMVDVDLGAQVVRATDLWGRSQEVRPTRTGHALRIGREPLFVEGVSREMCLFRRGFRVDPVFTESRRAPQEGTLVLANPWDKALSGTLSLADSGAVDISPRTHRFTIAPRGEVRLPVQFSIPRSTEAGVVPVRVEVEGTADEPFRAVITGPLEIGYRKATVEPSWRIARSIESGALDLVLTLRVTNVSGSPIDVEAFAGAEGYAVDRKLVSALPPGATAVRAFHFKDGARRLSGRDIRTGIHETETDARLLRRVSVPPLLLPLTEAVAGESDTRAP